MLKLSSLVPTPSPYHTTRPSPRLLFFYGGAAGVTIPSAARLGPYKAHWATGPGLGGCASASELTPSFSDGLWGVANYTDYTNYTNYTNYAYVQGPLDDWARPRRARQNMFRRLLGV